MVNALEGIGGPRTVASYGEENALPEAFTINTIELIAERHRYVNTGQLHAL